jgi:BUD22
MTSPTKDPSRRSDGNDTGKERQRGKLKRPREESSSTDRQAYYDRLRHQCHKDIHKHAKATKTFETQKLIRRIKKLQRDEKNAVAKYELKLQQLKAYSLEPVVTEAIRRLGLLQLDPKSHQHLSTVSGDATDQSSDRERAKTSDLVVEADPSIKGDAEGETATSNCTTDDNGIGAWILARILQHKSTCAAMEHWNEQITEYRRWCLRQQERIDGILDLERSSKKTKTKKSNPAISDPLATGACLFVTLGSSSSEPRSGEEGAASSSDPLGYYGPGGEAATKKNRQGQRGRRAKAAALVAKQQGRTLPESLNWRQSKRERAADDAPERLEQSRIRQKGKPEQHAESHDPSSTSSPSVLSESLHPSWQARKEQKAGIVAFQGTKITFSNG